MVFLRVKHRLLRCLIPGITDSALVAMKKFYGLRGTKLNIAIAVIAGTDFALFGYGSLCDMAVREGELM